MCAPNYYPLDKSFTIKLFNLDSVFQQTNSAKYLGVTITSNLSWPEHINNITNNANFTKAFLRRNLTQCQQTIKLAFYST